MVFNRQRAGYVDCIVGMQWGSEGKGKIVAYLAEEYEGCVRSGGPQAGHTFYRGRIKHINRQLPCGVASRRRPRLFITSNAVISPSILSQEIKRYHLSAQRLRVDRRATVLDDVLVEREQRNPLLRSISSTLTGVGAAQAAKIMRQARTMDDLSPKIWKPYLTNVSAELAKMLDNGRSILLEGTQGFGLSLSFGQYPFVTSRDVTSAALLADAGIAPQYYHETIGVMRTYPIRVGGPSGPTGSAEISWEIVQERSGAKHALEERGSVTGRVRRVFEPQYDILKEAIRVNGIQQIALTGIDHIATEDFGKDEFDELSIRSRRFIDRLEAKLHVPVNLIGTGPLQRHIIDRRVREL